MAQKTNEMLDRSKLMQLLRANDLPCEQIALRFGVQTWTYGTLLDQAQTVAAAICSHGIDDLHVGLSMDRGPDAFVAMLAVLLAGGKVVPVDTSYPQSYQRSIFETAGCALILSDKVTDAFDYPTYVFDALLETNAPQKVDLPRDGQAGFILFTSGTTGKPKGVVLPLAALIAAAQSFGMRTGINAQSIIAQYAGLSFDASVLEFLLAFVHGVPLNIMSASARVEPETLAQELVDHAVTHLILPAAVAPYLPLRADYNLQAFICVGDVLEDRVFHNWAAKYPTFNGYGPTEGAICASLHLVTPDQPVTLGTPLDHVQVKVGGIDAEELLIGGFGIASGYINNPVQTKERFQPDASGKIWYHTGDRVVRDEDTGALTFAGRFDFQAKVNGTRVEVRALEAALTAIDTVDDAAVLACAGADGQKFLAAFIATLEPAATAETTARATIAEAFPAGHMPSLFKVLPQLPLTTNQKIDRRALHDSLPTQSAGHADDPAKVAFLTELKLRDCDDDADFFHQGGNSIGVMRLLAGLEARTGKHVSVKDFRNTPTISGLRALLHLDGPASLEVIKNQRDTDELPLSAQQNTAWYMHRQDPHSKAYLAEAVHYFDGPLDVPALENALQDLFDAHEIYRTTFHDSTGVPVQKIHANHQARFLRIDAKDTPDKERDALLQNVIAKHLPGIPDLGQLPLANFALVCFGETDHAFVHQEHHIVHDGWGGSAFTAELLNRYHKLCDPTFDYELPEPAQYSDFLLTQDAWLGSPAAQVQVDYWRDQLAGAPQSVAIFGKTSTAPGFAGGHVRLDFSRDEWTQCETACARLGITPFGFTTAVLHVLMWQYSGQTDVVVGAPFANRNWRNAPDILGMLVNTIVLRQKIDTSQTLDDFAKATQGVVDGAYAHQELPFGHLVEALNPERLNGQNPLFNVLLGFHDAPIPVAEVAGFVWRKDETVISNTSKFDLDCLVVNRESHFTDDDRVSFLWEYRSDIYQAEEINNLVASFRQVFLQFCKDGTAPIGAVSILTPSQDKMMKEWENGPEVKLGHPFTDQDFATSLAQQLPRFADHVAIQTVDESLTYSALDTQSSALAAHIADQVAPNAKVAILAPRGVAQITAMVAVIKLKATIVCLDPNLPEARRDKLLRDCAPDLLLQAGDSVPVAAPCPVIQLDGKPLQSAALPDRATPKDHLAYVTYTSGSTGQPKGVMVQASGLKDECLHLMQLLELDDTSKTLCLSYVGFDAYHGEVWPSLMAGAKVVLVRDAERDNLPTLATIMSDFNVTAAVFPTGLFEQALTAGFSWPESLRILAAGGDRLGPVRVPNGFTARLFNLYGPTETTIDATFFEISPDLQTEPPIGQPKINTTAQVLDGVRRCPPGGAGELVIGGTGVAQGYLNRPDETQKSFVTLPDGNRYYRTGDLVRWQTDGQLSYLGRIDDEISLRGYRIAPSEITTALQQHPTVSQAAVALRNGALFAYITRAAAIDEDSMSDAKLSRVLKTNLKRILPDYMRPNAVIVLDKMPLTDQGKIDIGALPSPVAAPVERAEPRTDTEHRVLAMWHDLLPVGEISVTQNFFSVGGHSLLAMQLITNIQSSFGVALQIVDFFEAGTVRGLAEKIDLITAVTPNQMDDFAAEGEF